MTKGFILSDKEINELLNVQDKRIKELEKVLQQIIYETRAYHTEKRYEVCVSISPEMWERLNNLLNEKIKASW